MRDAAVRLLMCIVVGIVLGFVAAALICFLIDPIPADAQGVGIFTTSATGSRTSCSQLTDPVAGQTICFNQSNGEWVYYNGASFTQSPAALNIIGAGPHLIGWGDATPTLTNSFGLMYNGKITAATNANAYGVISAPNMTVAGSGTHPVFSGTELDFPHFISGAATVTSIAAVRIGADNLPPYASATSVYGLWLVNGMGLFAGGDNVSNGRPAVRIANNQVLQWLDSAGATSNSANIYQGTANRLVFGFNAGGSQSATMSLSSSGMLSFASTTAPSCADKCGTSPTVLGNNSAMRVTMGSTGTPASPFLVLFTGNAQQGSPSCISQLGTATATGTVTVTNTSATGFQVNTGSSPAQGVVYNIHCFGVQ